MENKRTWGELMIVSILIEKVMYSWDESWWFPIILVVLLIAGFIFH